MFKQYEKADLWYHNLYHTKMVVKRTLEIATNYSFSEADLFMLTTGGWFHDTGQLTGIPQGHEDRSVAIMKAFLQTNGVEEEMIKKVERSICATKLSQLPHSLAEEILCDADTFNLGTSEFCQTDGLLKKNVCCETYPLTSAKKKRWSYSSAINTTHPTARSC